MMCPVTDDPTSYEIHTVVIHFLHAKMWPIEIHSELCMVYGQNLISEGTVRQ
jgi:hypothetical protein